MKNGELIVRENRTLIVLEKSTNPKYNIRKESVLFRRIEKSPYDIIFRLWINEECLVRGISRSKRYGWYRANIAKKLKIPVYKRITGGGVVYHDLGNLNWSFFAKANLRYCEGKIIFEKFSNIIVEALNKIGIKAYFAQPNRIEVEGLKISGMAARVSNNALLIHGTLLVNTNLERLNMLCIPPPDSPPVENISKWKKVSVDLISKELIKYVRKIDFKKSI